MRRLGLILDDAEVDALQHSTFELDCLTIRLERGTGDDAVVYTGPGSIRRTSAGRTHLRLYAQNQYDPDPGRLGLAVPVRVVVVGGAHRDQQPPYEERPHDVGHRLHRVVDERPAMADEAGDEFRPGERRVRRGPRP